MLVIIPYVFNDFLHPNEIKLCGIFGSFGCLCVAKTTQTFIQHNLIENGLLHDHDVRISWIGTKDKPAKIDDAAEEKKEEE